MKVARLSSIALLLIPHCYGSAGDRDPAFQNCVASCSTAQCYAGTPVPESLPLRLTRWTCLDDCKYSCTHSITDDRASHNARIYQYYGKWPFYRLLGMQEPASVLFSLANLYFHWQGFKRLRRQVNAEHPMKWYYLSISIIQMNTWMWSSVFHTRDLPRTEKFDYFSAALSILSSLWVAVIRIFHLYPEPRRPLSSDVSSHTTNRLRQLWTTICVIVYTIHIGYLGLSPRFDYSYNIIANLIVGLTHNILWLLFSLPIPLFKRYPSKPASYRPSFSHRAAIFVLLTTGAMTLELLDFPPFGRTIDAHSLWHLATAPIAGYWYDFLVLDCHDEGWGGNIGGRSLRT